MSATLKYVKEFQFGGAVKAAVHKHEKSMRPGKEPTPLKKGGPAKITPVRKSVPVAPMSPLLALKCGGRAKK